MSKQNNSPKTVAPRPMQLEQRLMFDGAAVDTVADVAADHVDPTPEASDSPSLFSLGVAYGNSQQATEQATQQIQAYLSGAEASEVFSLLNGGQDTMTPSWLQNFESLRQDILSEAFSLQVDFLSGSDMAGALAAFAEHNADGSPTIYLNREWIDSGVSAEVVSRFLVEEFGHGMDAVLNPNGDTPGDEGEHFAATVLDRPHGANDFSEDDHITLNDEGIALDGEAAGSVFNANFAQLSFDSATAISGTGRAQGDIVRFNNVITIDGQVIDAVVTTTEVSGAQFSTYDSSSSPTTNSAYFQPLLGNSTSAGGYVRFSVDFYAGGTYTGVGTGTALTLQNVVVNSYDIDRNQFQVFKGFSRYELSDSTGLTVSTLGDGSVRFTDANSPYLDLSGTDDQGRVKVYYDSVKTFELQTGTDIAGTSYFSLDFSVGPAWTGSTTIVGTPAANITYDDGIADGVIRFSEAGANDGSIATTATITLANAVFSGTNGSEIAGVTFGNVPTGLTAHVIRTSDTTATLSFSGTATNHADADDVGDVTVTFGDASFNGTVATAVTGYSRSDINIDFDDPTADVTPPTVTGGQTFNYAENRSANAVIGTVVASDAVGVTAFRFTNSGGTPGATSTDGYYSIDSSGVIRITAAGVAAGVAQNDYETGSNSFAYGVQAGDAAGNWSNSVDVTLNVTDLNDESPVFVDGSNNPVANYSFTYDENSATTDVIGQVATTDADAGDSVSYSITANVQDGGNDLFAIDSNTGDITLTAEGVAAFSNDFEALANSHSITVRATDGNGNTTDIAVTLGENDLNDESPVFVDGSNNPVANYSFTYDENSATTDVIGQVATTDADAGDSVSYSITANVQDGGNDLFAIDGSTGEITLTAEGVAAFSNDFEALANSHSITVRATDGNGNTTDITVNLGENDLNDESPVFVDGSNNPVADYSFTYDENSATTDVIGQVATTDADAGDSVSYSITANVQDGGNDLFAIDGSTGEITLTAAGVAAFSNDFEALANSHSITVRATDGNGNTTDIAVTLGENDLNDESPVFVDGSNNPVANYSFTYDENSATTDVIGQVATTDADAGDSVSYSITANVQDGGNDLFTVNAGTGEITLTAEGVAAFSNDFEALANAHSITIRATDGNGNTTDITVNLGENDLNDESPVFVDGSNNPVADYSFTYDENSATTDVIGEVATTDADAGDSVSYSITANVQDGGNDLFAIDGSTGEITLTAEGVAAFSNDFESLGNSHSITVRATDGNGNTTDTNVSLTETDDVQDNTITVAGGTFNETSPRAVFEVSATQGQNLEFEVQDSAEGSNNATSGIAGSQVFYSLDSGQTWSAYTNGPVTAGGVPVLVAVDIAPELDAVYEGGEQLRLVVNGGSVSESSAYSSVVDDGTGTVTTAIDENTIADDGGDTAAIRDDDRPINVQGGDYNENSPRAVFTVDANPGQLLDFEVLDNAPSGGAATSGLAGSTIYISVDGGATWSPYSGTSVTAGNQDVLVAVDISAENDRTYEGQEQFQLVVNGGMSTESTAYVSINDDGTGDMTGDIDDTTVGDDGSPQDLPRDDDTPTPAPTPAPAPAPAPAPVVTTSPAGQGGDDRAPEAQQQAGSSQPAETTTPSSEGELMVLRDIPQQTFSTENGLTTIAFTIPADTFGHTEPGADISLSATMADGQPLPGWLSFNADKGEFQGIAPEDFEGVLIIRVIARDENGHQVETEVRIEVRHGDRVSEVLGKPSLMQQLQKQDAFAWKAERDRLIRLAHDLAQVNGSAG